MLICYTFRCWCRSGN